MEMVVLEAVNSSEDEKELKTLVENHLKFTDSNVASLMLKHWERSLGEFVKVMPTDYKRALQQAKKKGSSRRLTTNDGIHV